MSVKDRQRPHADGAVELEADGVAASAVNGQAEAVAVEPHRMDGKAHQDAGNGYAHVCLQVGKAGHSEPRTGDRCVPGGVEWMPTA